MTPTPRAAPGSASTSAWSTPTTTERSDRGRAARRSFAGGRVLVRADRDELPVAQDHDVDPANAEPRPGRVDQDGIELERTAVVVEGELAHDPDLEARIGSGGFLVGLADGGGTHAPPARILV